MKAEASCFSSNLKVITLTLVVIVSFVLSSFGWRHIELSRGNQILVAAVILLAMYLLMIFELVNRNLAALIGAGASVAAHDCLLGHVDMAEIIQWEDLETLALLFGMMIIVGILSRSGLFDFLAIWSYKQSAGRFWLLITIMSFITALLSAFIDNVSTMLLMAPTLIKLSQLEHIDPRYVLMIMVIFCNIGGCATPVGDPPNLIIIGDSLVSTLGVSFGSFVAYCGPCVLITMAVVLIYLRLVYKSKESFRGSTKLTMEEPTTMINNNQLEQDIELLQTFRVHLKQLNDKLTIISTEPMEQELDKQIMKMNSKENYGGAIEVVEVPKGSQTMRRGSRLSMNEIDQLMQVYSIKSWPILIQSLIVLITAVVLFFIQSIPGTNLTLGWISLFAGLTLLVLTSTVQLGDNQEEEEEEEEEKQDNFEWAINEIEWSTLMFFFALFIVMEAMERLGLIGFMGQQITQLVGLIPEGQWRSIGAISIILWSSGVASACIDNVPFTSMMIKVLAAMVEETKSTSTRLVVESNGQDLATLKPLVFALAFGACFGGNGSLIGASANLVTAGVAGRHNYPMSFGGFFKFAAPVTVISLIVANIYLVFVFVVLGL